MKSHFEKKMTQSFEGFFTPGFYLADSTAGSQSEAILENPT